VWEGDDLSNLTELAANDDYGSSQSAIFINAISGSTYQIAVYGYYGDSGSLIFNISSDSSSRISGTITGPDGITPLAGIQAVAYRWDVDGEFWDRISDAMTDTSGNYTIVGLTAANYRVLFEDWVNGHYLTEVYVNAPDLDSGMDINVGDSTHVTDINASLASLSSISGIVTGPDGTSPLAGIEVRAYRWNANGGTWDLASYDLTDASGYYRIGGLAAASYRVEFLDIENGAYLTETYENSPDLNSGADIVVADGTEVTSINASLGTVPPPVITEFRKVSETGFEIRYTGVIGRRYMLQYSETLKSWTNGDEYVCSSGENVISVNRSSPQMFWRLMEIR
jgi:hypothetical protein